MPHSTSKITIWYRNYASTLRDPCLCRTNQLVEKLWTKHECGRCVYRRYRLTKRCTVPPPPIRHRTTRASCLVRLQNISSAQDGGSFLRMIGWTQNDKDIFGQCPHRQYHLIKQHTRLQPPSRCVEPTWKRLPLLRRNSPLSEQILTSRVDDELISKDPPRP